MAVTGIQWKGFFPAIEPYETGHLKVSDLHTIYYEQSGNPRGKPIVMLHGGPGSGSSPSLRCWADPSIYRIITFDQRGTGKSTPTSCIEENTLWDLVEDLEKLRKHLAIEKWVLCGGSWGSTLAIAYAETYPNQPTALVIRGIMLCRRKELLWLYQDGARFLFPDAWEDFTRPIPPVERGDLMLAYSRRLTGVSTLTPQAAVAQLPFARAWTVWEKSVTGFYYDKEQVGRALQDDQYVLNFARIELHYFVNGSFLSSQDQLLEQVQKICHIPTTIIQGRYDIVCPILSAWELHKAFPEAKFVIVPDNGHAGKEPGILHHTISAIEEYSKL